jgi:hypothetical protein
MSTNAQHDDDPACAVAHGTVPAAAATRRDTAGRTLAGLLADRNGRSGGFEF